MLNLKGLMEETNKELEEMNKHKDSFKDSIGKSRQELQEVISNLENKEKEHVSSNAEEFDSMFADLEDLGNI